MIYMNTNKQKMVKLVSFLTKKNSIIFYFFLYENQFSKKAQYANFKNKFFLSPSMLRMHPKVTGIGSLVLCKNKQGINSNAMQFKSLSYSSSPKHLLYLQIIYCLLQLYLKPISFENEEVRRFRDYNYNEELLYIVDVQRNVERLLVLVYSQKSLLWV